MSPPAVPDIVFEHLEETAFLWIQRRRMLFSPDAPRRALARLDDRLAAHRDGLRLGGATTARLAEEQLAEGDAWLMAAAALAWLECAEPAPQAVRDRTRELDAALVPAWREALRQLPAAAFERLAPSAEALPADAVWAELVVDARGWRGKLDARLSAAAVRSEHPGVRRAVARHSRERELLGALLQDADGSVRERALWSFALADPGAAVKLARSLLSETPPVTVALRVLGCFGEAADGDRLAPLLGREPVEVAVIEALRDLAVVRHAKALLSVMEGKDEDAAAVAREAFESLLGPIPAPDDEHPLPAGMSAADVHWQQVGARADANARRLRGTPFAWAGPAEHEPQERLWRRALSKSSAEDAELRREVPDGIFDGAPASETRPGL